MKRTRATLEIKKPTGGSATPNSVPSTPTAAAATAAAAAAFLLPASAVAAARQGAALEYGPRCSGERLRKVREAYGMSITQFSQLLADAQRAAHNQPAPHHSNRRTADPEAPGPRRLSHYEAGLGRVPMQVYLRAEELYAKLLAEQAAAAAEAGPFISVPQEYPKQESLVGAEFQASVPKHPTGGRPSARADECVWSPRAAQREMGPRDSLSLAQYVSKARAAIEADGRFAFREECVLEVLKGMGYNAKAALQSLELCLAWRRGGEAAADALDELGDEGGRAALLHSIVWLDQLESRRRGWGEGDLEALYAGLCEHGKDLAVIRERVLSERSVAEVVEMYYCSDAWQRLKRDEEQEAQPKPV